MNTKRLLSISLDYVQDDLYILEGEQLSVFSLNTLESSFLFAGNQMQPMAMHNFNNFMYFISRYLLF